MLNVTTPGHYFTVVEVMNTDGDEAVSARAALVKRGRERGRHG
jgi:hypothetical protein